MTYKISILLSTYNNGNVLYSVPFVPLKKKKKELNDNTETSGDLGTVLNNNPNFEILFKLPICF